MREIALNTLCKTIGYTFRNKDLLEQAMTHRSCENSLNNERLEFLGDSVLGCVITSTLFERFPLCREGELTRLRSSLVKGETLAKLAQDMGIGVVIKLGFGELNTGGFRRKSTLEDAFEALVGAIYLDSDFVTTRGIVLRWFEPMLAIINTSHIPRDYKSQLQEELQAKELPTPLYKVLREEGPDHEKLFFVRCSIERLDAATEGTGRGKKIAEQEAARRMLALLENITA